MPVSEDQIAQVTEYAATSLRNLPLSAHAIVLTALIGGAILWLFGQKSMRLGFTLVGLFGGAALGLIIPAAFGIGIPVLLGVGIGAVGGLVMGVTLFRATVATALAVILAIAAPLATAVAMGIKPASIETTESGPLLGDDLFLKDVPLEGDDDHAQTGEELIRNSGEKVSAFLAQLGEQIRPKWEALSTSQRNALIGSSVLGALFGALFGGLMPKRMAAVMTAFAGAALVLPSGAWLASAASADVERWLPRAPLTWLVVWLILGVIGAGLQWARSGRRADKR